MDIAFFIRGAVVGFSIAAPVGPIGGVGLFRSRFDAHRLRWVNRISGIIAGFGVAALLSLR
jgi:hypothetical protein